MRERDQIDELTASLRRSADPLWVRLRILLEERAVDPERSLLVQFFPDDGELYFGIVVTQDKRAVQFDLDLQNRTSAEATLSRWNDITNSSSSPHAGSAEAGLFRLERERGAIL